MTIVSDNARMLRKHYPDASKHCRDRACFAVTLMLVFLNGAAAHAARTGTMGHAEGTPAAIACPNKTYLAGFAIQYDTSMSGLQPYCATMASDGAWSGGAQIHLGIMMSEALPGGKRLDMFCARDFYVSGFRGYSHVYGIHSIMQLTVICKNVKTGTLAAIATTHPGASVTEWPGAQCPVDSVAEGVFGYINAGRIIQFGLSCERTRPATLLEAKLKGSAPPLAQLLPASILSPINGQRFYNQTVVPIKLAPPPSWSVSLYTVNIQRKDKAGNWINHSSLPVGPAQAHSANGYTEFGAGGKDGRSLAFLTSPGAWRLNAQIAAPKQSSWSPWVEFGVMAPPTSSNALKPGRLR